MVFDGLDCIAAVWVNGKRAGRAANMFIPHRFDVTGLVHPAAGNELLARIDPAVLVARQLHHTPDESNWAGHWERATVLRKAEHEYGFDMGPRIISAGLWRDVHLEVLPPTHWKSVYWATTQVDAKKKSAKLVLDWEFATPRIEIRDLQLRVILSRNGKTVLRRLTPVLSTHGQDAMGVADVALWWPRGAGDQPLYDAVVTLLDHEGHVLDENKTRIGIRTVQLHNTEFTSAEKPGDFAFLVNGEKIFIKGTNWIPLDVLHSRDRKLVEEVFPMVLDLHCNMIRCWGGYVYESDRFFDLCDENGVLVWQEFCLGNARYPQRDEFFAAMREEAAAIIPRLRNHPSLAHWCGGSECDICYVGENMDPNTNRRSQ